jgi:predicted helicase
VKNPEAEQQGKICFHDIGDYLAREEKLEKIETFSSIAGITAANAWQSITPDQHGDWLNQRDDGFGAFISLGDKKDSNTAVLFENYSCGVKTQRDSWCYNASKVGVIDNMKRMIGSYNGEVERFSESCAGLDKPTREARVDGFINTDPTRISWTHNLKQELIRNRHIVFEENSLTPSLYRPFTKHWLYYNRCLNERVYQMPRIFPDEKAENLVILVDAKYLGDGFVGLITDRLPDLHCNGDSQCFPLYLYDDEARTEEPVRSRMESLFGDSPKPVPRPRCRRDALTDEGLGHFTAAYPGEVISKEDVFFYVYGLLHSPDYRERYADNLAKELPRIPCVKTAADFWAFSQAGRKLADLHLNYETVEPYPLTITVHGDAPLTDADYRVEKMRYGKTGKEKDLTTVHYNNRITVSGIPLEAYEYIVNGKPALDWVMERQCVKTDRDSGIVNDANDWAVETLGNPRYPLKLFQNVVTVSLETMKIVNGLSKLDIAAN